MNKTVAGLFVGCGGLDFGFKLAGFDIVWANESDPDAAKSYNQLIQEHVVVNDINSVITEVPNVDLIIGGPPCQSFSLVGKRLEDDPRGQLVFAFKRVVERIKPFVFVMENVPGLTSSRINGERLHIYLAKQFMSIGYDVKISKLNAIDFFVPQRRKRIFIIGCLKSFLSFNMVSPNVYSQILGYPELQIPVTVSEALDDLSSPTSNKEDNIAFYRSISLSPYAKLMRSDQGNNISLHYVPTMSDLDKAFVKHIPPGGNFQDIPDEISTSRIMKFKSTGGRTTTYGRLHPDEPAYTINTYFNRPNVGANYHHSEDRLITPREGLRLQSFPDFFSPIYSSQRSLYRQIGNAVPPLMSRAIAESIKQFFL